MPRPLSSKPATRAICRIETDFTAAFQFLQFNRYPYFWSPDRLTRCAVVRVEDRGGSVIGYVWGEWLDVSVMAFHVCAREGTRLPLHSTDLLDQLLTMAFWLGADVAMTALDGHPRPKPIERLLKSFGFAVTPDAHGEDTYTLNLRTYHGL